MWNVLHSTAASFNPEKIQRKRATYDRETAANEFLGLGRLFDGAEEPPPPPTLQEARREYEAFFRDAVERIECTACQKSCKEANQHLPSSLSSKADLQRWAFQFHESVRARLSPDNRSSRERIQDEILRFQRARQKQ